MFLKTIITNYITFGFASAITLFPFVLVSTPVKLRPSLVRHERIHLCQQVEMLIIPFYLLYIVEFLLKWIYYKSQYQAYRNISFEREAYANQNDPYYIKRRRYYSWIRYI